MYAEIKNGQVVRFPYTEVELSQDNPYTQFKFADVAANYVGTERNAAGFELVSVQNLPRPEFSEATQNCALSDTPTLLQGNWVLNWVISSKTAQEVQDAAQAQSATVRTVRNDRLGSSDWTQLADSTADKTAWATYRQALRDVPSQAGFPWTVTWPDAP